jgi:hypothetical protein
MRSTADRKTWLSTLAPVAPRLEVRPDRSTRALLDGAWWPGSRTTVTELTNLVTALDARQLPITRVMLNPDGWDEHPRRISVAGRTVQLGWFATLEACLLIATADGDQRLDLLVIPPQTSATTAAAATAMAVDGANTSRAGAIMSAASPRAPRRRLSVPSPEAARKSEDGLVNGHRAGRSS